jgi:hypothetical protein
MKFKMAKTKDEDFPALSERQIEKLRKKLRERLSHEEVERSWRLEALDRIFTASMVDEQSFHQFWVKPLLSTGLSLETVLALIVDSYFQPN